MGRTGLSLQELAKVCLGSKSAEEQLVEGTAAYCAQDFVGSLNSEKGGKESMEDAKEKKNYYYYF